MECWRLRQFIQIIKFIYSCAHNFFWNMHMPAHLIAVYEHSRLRLIFQVGHFLRFFTLTFIIVVCNRKVLNLFGPKNCHSTSETLNE